MITKSIHKYQKSCPSTKAKRAQNIQSTKSTTILLPTYLPLCHQGPKKGPNLSEEVEEEKPEVEEGDVR